MDSYKKERIDSLIEVLSEILGTRESVYETMAFGTLGPTGDHPMRI